MSEKKKTNPSPPKTVKRRGAPAFPIGQLRRDCLALFGVTQSTFDGAAYGMEGAFTIAGMKRHIEGWLNNEREEK